MPDTSAAASDWSGVGFALTGLAAGILAWIGKAHAGKDQAKSPVASLPEVAGVSMALIDAKVQAEIAADTARTAEAAEQSAAAAERMSETLERVEDVMRKFISDAEDAREEQVKRDLENKLRDKEREVERMEKLLDDARRQAGPYTTQPRK